MWYVWCYWTNSFGAHCRCRFKMSPTKSVTYKYICCWWQRVLLVLVTVRFGWQCWWGLPCAMWCWNTACCWWWRALLVQVRWCWSAPSANYPAFVVPQHKSKHYNNNNEKKHPALTTLPLLCPNTKANTKTITLTNKNISANYPALVVPKLKSKHDNNNDINKQKHQQNDKNENNKNKHHLAFVFFHNTNTKL